MATKAEDLIEKQQQLIENLSKRVDELEEELKATPRPVHEKPKGAPFVRDDHPEEGGGWVVQTKNENYNGKTAGVKFNNGAALVYADRPNADMIVQRLEKDFGYVVQAMDANGMTETRKLIDRLGEGTPSGSVADKLAASSMQRR